MMAAGQMPKGDLATFIPKNIITRSLGPHADVQVDLEGPFPLEVGDTFLLCSDGLSGQVKDEEIGALMAALSPSDAVRALVDVANLRGGPDNITAIAVRVAAVPSEQPVDAPPEPDDPAATVHPIVWGLMALCLLVALVLAMSRYYLGALVSVLVGAVCAVVALVQNMATASSGDSQHVEGPLGSGPHAAFDCRPSAESAAAAAQLSAQLREATRNEHWTLDWAHFNALSEQAQQAQKAGDYTAAVRNHALAISFMMNEIRRQAAHKDHRDNSVLDL